MEELEVICTTVNRDASFEYLHFTQIKKEGQAFLGNFSIVLSDKARWNKHEVGRTYVLKLVLG